MPKAFIFQNQHQQYLNKSSEWVDGSESQALLKTLYKDEALNIKAEQSVRNPELRLSIVPCTLNTKGHPELSAPTTQPKPHDESNPLTEQPTCDKKLSETIKHSDNSASTSDIEEAKSLHSYT